MTTIIYTAAFVLSGTIILGEMYRTHTGPLLLLKRWVTYMQAVWLLLGACWILAKWETSTHWRRHLAEARKAV